MVYPLIWPSILVASSERWNLNTAPSRSGGRSIANQEQVVRGPSGYATASIVVPCKSPGTVLAMRGFLAAMDGRAGSVLIGPMEGTRAPWFVESLAGGKVTYSRGAGDAALDPAFETSPDTASTLDFRTAGAVTMNAAAMTIQRNRGGLLSPGMIFSIGGRLHVITALTSTDPGADAGYAAAGQVDIGFRPWLRADYVAGTPIEFGRPLGTMRLATDDTGAMELQLSRSGTVTLDFVEKF